jgi:Flp pilus assembly protein CpaB
MAELAQRQRQKLHDLAQGAARSLQELESARARTDLFEGEPVSDRKIIAPDAAGFMAAILPRGMRAISVRISAESGAGGFILPNDRVDVILISKNDGGGRPRTVSESVLTNVRVLAIDQTSRPTTRASRWRSARRPPSSSIPSRPRSWPWWSRPAS